ncbi:MAG: glycosyltransferase family 39 protein [Nanoarchaeota archaeon]|nr:glycosyltransferase family 39 protein [Nanoarchaeota archaeon]
MKRKQVSHKKPLFRKIPASYFIVFFLFALLVFLAYFLILKHNIVDETMLYSWAWIVNYLNVKLFFALLLLGIVISILAARVDWKFKEKHFLVFIFVVAFVLSSFSWSFPTPNPDIAEFFGVSKFVSENGLFSFFKDFGTEELSGYRFHSWPIILGLFFRVFGESFLLAKILYSVLFAFIPVLTFLLAKKLFSSKIAFISAFFVLSIPNLLVQSSMFLVDVPTAFFVLLSLYIFSVFLDKKNPFLYLVLTLVFLITIFSKRTAILFLIISCPVLFFYHLKKNNLKFSLSSRKTFLIVYALFIIIFSFVFLKLNFFSEQISLDLSQANIISNPAHYVNSWSYFFQFQPLIIVAFLVFILFFIFKPTFSKLFILCWIFFPFLFVQGTTLRYMIPAFSAVAIGAAVVVSRLKKKAAVFLVALIFCSSLISFFVGFSPLLKNEFYDNNILLSAKYVNSLKSVETIGVYFFYKDLERVQSPKTEIFGYVFDYYSEKQVFYDTSESVRNIYDYQFSRFDVFDFYRDKNYLSPDYDAIVIFSNVFDWQDLDFSDVKTVLKFLEENYALNKTFSVGKSGIEKNEFGFVYIKNR